jgi:myo-inositol-1-phosphate synthase
VTTTWSGHRAPAGRIGVLFAGLGSISTTLIAGVQAIKQGLGRPVGSLALLGSLDTGTAQAPKLSYIRDFLDLVSLDQLVFGGWDIVQTDGYAAAKRAAVLQPELLDQLKPDLSQIRPWPGIFDSRFNKRADVLYRKKGRDFMELADQVKSDILRFQDEHKLDRSVLLWCGSTEAYLELSPAHETLAGFEAAMRQSDHAVIAPSMIYAYAALTLGLPFVNATPSRTVDIPALVELATKSGADCGIACSASKAGSPPTSWGMPTAKRWTTRRRSRQNRNRSSPY